MVKTLIYSTILLLFSAQSMALSQTDIENQIKENHHLVVIQKISSTKNSFIIRKGHKDRVFNGQRSLFSSKNISFVARVVNSNREYSQWVLEDKESHVPFKTGEIVTISYSVERVWTEIPKLMTDERYNQILAIEQKQLRKKYSTTSDIRYQVLASKTKGINESTSGSENNEGDRSGNNFKFKLIKPFSQTLNWEFGLRYDSDLLTLSNPEVEVESQRYMLTAGLQAKFNTLWGISTTPYASISLGIGKSQSQINDAVQSGTATLLPSLTVGLDFAMNETTAVLVELSVESLNSKESFSDGVEQTTNITSTMLSIGLEFQ
jgi:hypothetical protein